jgi:hypothetical protein
MINCVLGGVINTSEFVDMRPSNTINPAPNPPISQGAAQCEADESSDAVEKTLNVESAHLHDISREEFDLRHILFSVEVHCAVLQWPKYLSVT